MTLIKVDNEILRQLVEKIILDDDDQVLKDGIKTFDEVALKTGMDMTELLRQVLIRALQSGNFPQHEDYLVVKDGELYVQDD